MIHQANADNCEQVASLLRIRGRIVITAPRRIGKTTELLRCAEEKYPNGRFAVVCANDDVGKYITHLHWCIYNGRLPHEVVAAKLLGTKLEGEDINPPQILTPETAMYRVYNASTPVFVDEWNLLSEQAQKAILKHRLFIAAVTS